MILRTDVEIGGTGCPISFEEQTTIFAKPGDLENGSKKANEC
jgi:hypothetical protein